jgi:uncharacterized short protein YbdD (DUF466 family)
MHRLNWRRAEAMHLRLGRALRSWLSWLNGDTAYARYREHAQKVHPDVPPLSQDEFFRRETERRWNGVRRCC